MPVHILNPRFWSGNKKLKLFRLEVGFMQAQQDQNSQGAGFTPSCIAFDKL